MEFCNLLGPFLIAGLALDPGGRRMGISLHGVDGASPLGASLSTCA